MYVYPGAFQIRELAWEDVPEPPGREACQEEALSAAPFIDHITRAPPSFMVPPLTPPAHSTRLEPLSSDSGNTDVHETHSAAATSHGDDASSSEQPQGSSSGFEGDGTGPEPGYERTEGGVEGGSGPGVKPGGGKTNE
jgi:hypothetical protein